ncbi:MAG: phosphoglucosamine mutase [Deltaproteobacteria bacterium]|nr:phosphoglucosamine mutase [Deltaproteobacteria bacterium]
MSLFGTDGVRGKAGVGPLSPEGALALATAFGVTVRSMLGDGAVAIARDTRESGPMLASVVAAGLTSAGCDVIDLGVVPTPALSWWMARTDGLLGGVMITASHNPWFDNGLKLFAADGSKTPDAVQRAAEARLGEVRETDRFGAVKGAKVLPDYLESLAGAFAGGGRLDGRLVVADSAAGAAFEALPLSLSAAGAEVRRSSPPPTGRNINDGCGAVHPEELAAAVVKHGAWAGVSVDGDGDRVTLVDERGVVHDGDPILGFLADGLLRAGQLAGDVVVGTVTTNSGLERYLADRGVSLLRSAVGDRNVAALMETSGAVIGGESSGHVLTPHLCPTGDGIRVALEVLRQARLADEPLSALLGAIPRDPSSKRSVRVGARPALDSLPPLVALLEEADAALHAGGARRLLRYSGTEPVLRIQVEGPARGLVDTWADRIEACARECIPPEA